GNIAIKSPRKNKVSFALDSYVPSEKFKEILKISMKKEIERQIQTEKHYFSPHRTKKQATLDFAKTIQSNRLIHDDPTKVKELTVNNQPTRRLITAEISTIEASLRIFGRNQNNSWYDTELGWCVAETIQFQGNPVK